MKFRLPWVRDIQPDEVKEVSSLDQILSQIAGLYQTTSGISITPENCMKSPTVHAIVTAVQNRLSVSELKVMRTSINSKGRVSREAIPSHPVARLLRKPNSWQTQDEFFSDAASSLRKLTLRLIEKLEQLHSASMALKLILSGAFCIRAWALGITCVGIVR
jgi:hypothetical protein